MTTRLNINQIAGLTSSLTEIASEVDSILVGAPSELNSFSEFVTYINNNFYSGVTGPAGPIGATGVAGMIGTTGVEGMKGITGSNGVQGATGPNGSIILAQSSSTTTVSGTTSNTLVYSKLISGNTIGANDGLVLSVKCSIPSSQSAFKSVRVYVNSSASLSSATLLATYTTTNVAFRYFEINRIINVDGATSAVISPSTSLLTDKALASTNTISDVSINWTVNQYFIVAIQLGNNADTTSLRMVKLILNKGV